MITEIERKGMLTEIQGIKDELATLRDSSNELLQNIRSTHTEISMPFSGEGNKMIYTENKINSQQRERRTRSQRPDIYRAKRGSHKTTVGFADAKNAVRLDVRLVEEPAFPYTRCEPLNSPHTIFVFVRSIQDCDVEKLIILHLNSALVLNCIQVFPGTINRANYYIREIIKASLLSASSNIIMVHNHPAGNLKFSDEDRIATNELKAAASCMDIKVLDHVLIAGGWYKSIDEKTEI